MAESPEDYELFHYGVKGMKWGVRKSGGGVKTSRLERKLAEKADEAKTHSSDHKTAQKLRRKPLETMSNDDIKTLNKRLELETNYARLMESTRKKGAIEKGFEFALGINKQTDRVANVYNSPTASLVKKAFKN
jgi:hypothetical protein